MNRIMIMRPILFIIFTLLLCSPLVLFAIFMSNYAKQKIEEREARENPPPKKYTKNDFLDYDIDPDLLDAKNEYTKKPLFNLSKEYATCPPLRPDRFRRRVKMLWGIDINEYPEDATISIYKSLSNWTFLSKKYQMIQTFSSNVDDGPVYHYKPKPIPEDDQEDKSDLVPFYNYCFEPKIYPIYRRYLYMNNKEDMTYLLQYGKNHYKQLKKLYPDLDGYRTGEDCNILFMRYRSAIFDVSSTLLDNHLDLGLGLLYPDDDEVGIPTIRLRHTDIRLDGLSVYIKKALAQGKEIRDGILYADEEKNKNILHMGFNYNKKQQSLAEYNWIRITNGLCRYDDSSALHPWHNYTAARGVAAFLAFSLNIQDTNLNKEVLDFMKFDSHKIEYENSSDIYRQEIINRIKKDIRANNYFGYTLLREYDNNLMREMPTLAKIGTSFQGAVKQANTLLYLEPFKDSYSIDTLQTYETFTAYEMGHDDYYFVEVEKPVESPIAGTNGYAKIIDRTEIVHGYIEKSKVMPYTDAQLLTHPHFTDHTSSKKGVINDKDGYVNVRAERNTKSEVVDKLVGIEFVEYWQLMGNWYIVETRNGKRGFVYKDRIKEIK